MIIAFLEFLRDNPHLVKISVSHKRFALLCKLVDLIVEPVAHATGFNMYKHGSAIALANLLFYVLLGLGGEAFFLELLQRFQRMVRDRTSAAYDSFFSLVFQSQPKQNLDEIMDQFRIAHSVFGYGLYDEIDEDTLDLAFTETIPLMAKWRADTTGPLYLIHDMPSPMVKEKQLWDKLTDPSLPAAEVGYGQKRMKFPIAIERTDFEASHNWVGLQLADIVAGAITLSAKWSIEGRDSSDQYPQRVLRVMDTIGAQVIWPEPKVKEEELQGDEEGLRDPIEYIIENVYEDTPQ